MKITVPLFGHACLLFLATSVGANRAGGAEPAPQWIDHNHNGSVDPYEDPTVPVDKRVQDLLTRMILEEKIGQMLHPNQTTLMIGSDSHRNSPGR